MSYTSTELFQDKRINAIADRLYYFLAKDNVSVTSLEQKFLLTGMVAAIMQNQETKPSENIVWITHEDVLFNYILQNIEIIFPKTLVIKFKERILLDFNYTKIEIWKSSTRITAIEYDVKIYCQLYSEIPNILLS